MKFKTKPILIIGSGIAGLYSAIRFTEIQERKVLLVTKDKLKESNSRYAQGGIAGVLPENLLDSVDLHVKDTVEAGAGLSDEETAKFISVHSAEAIKDLIKYGVEFDRDSKNEIQMTLEAAHSVSRILHAGGDATGKSIETALAVKAEKAKNIEIYQKTQAVELLVDSQNICRGAILFNSETGEYETVYSSAVIIATGGSGQVYSNTTNPEIASGDGISLAYRAGAVIQDMEFVQFHPTALNIKEKGSRFLISESVRGEGASLINPDGEHFTDKYDIRGDLAPRDVVTRAIFFEMRENDYKSVLLDTSSIPNDRLNQRFPNIIRACSESGIDIFRSPIPVSPAAHYIMGGIKIDIKGRTSIKGLYAVGEASCSSLNGANRLASNSLLECVVIADEMSKNIVKNFQEAPPEDYLPFSADDCRIQCLVSLYEKRIFDFKPDIFTMEKTLRQVMWEKVGIIRNEKGLSEALRTINELSLEFAQEHACRNIKEYGFRSMLTIAELITKSAIARKESRGSHFREDYPEKSNKAYHSYISKSVGYISTNMYGFAEI